MPVELMLGLFAIAVPVPSTNLTPSLLILMPPAASLITKPLLSNLLFPVVTEVKLGLSLVATVISLPFCVIATFLPAINFTSWSGETCVEALPDTVPPVIAPVLTFQPLFALLATSLTIFNWSSVAA
ncbi:hypothetical protein AVENLUH5627_00005 [Acinetobacter venetianus]|uniref:Uncharacterized protein n=1 Tax=Acinetobacter venetianus TaxID=52133 RepID=A0A150I3B2_9GAMM|nr:hypothetical protein AVENLUH5627_00005 [Acinetobacter venetianus]